MMFFFLTMHFLSKPFLRHFGYAAFSHLESTVDEFDDISPQRFQGPKGVGKMCFIPRVHVVTQEGLLFFFPYKTELYMEITLIQIGGKELKECWGGKF